MRTQAKLRSNLKKWCPSFFVLLLVSTSTPFTSNAEATPKSHVTTKLSDPSVKCDTCELPPPPPPPPACPPPPPPPCPPPPPPPKAPSCVPCSTTPEVNPPPPPTLSYITSGQGQGNVYVTDPYGADMYSGQIRSSVADFIALFGLLALLPIMMWL